MARRRATPSPKPDAAEDIDLDDGLTPQPAAPVKPQPAAPKHSPRLTKLADDLGITKAEQDAMSSADLEAEVRYARDLATAEQGRKAAERTAAEKKPEEKPADDEYGFMKPMFEQEVDMVETDGSTVKRKLTEADFPSGLLTVLKTMGKELNDFKKLQTQQVSELTEIERRRRDAVIDAALDDGFAALGSQYEGIFGKGTARELDAAGKADELKLRIKLLKMAGADPTKHSPKELRELIKTQAVDLYGKVIKPAANQPEGSLYDGEAPKKKAPKTDPAQKRKQDAEAEEWEDAQVARPTSRNGAAEPKGTEAADNALANRLEAMGFPRGARRPTAEENDLPD